MTSFPSKLIEDAVSEIAKLPGIGRKSAFRIVLHLLKQETSFTENLTSALTRLRNQIRYCSRCFNISDEEVCSICTSSQRDTSVICVVENFKDLLAVENTGQFRGLYHVLGGLIAPIENITPDKLKIQELIQRVENENISEIILALSASIEGDTTAFYITKQLKHLTHLKITSLARGLPIGSELEYADEITLGRSIQARVAYGI
ncbi:recombination mediator RecR [Raineya orbicola]|jgi:recombination protein RecR|uniref:Recombination protein RecR n=1 Tax=Raineya orbicola TaxID=2016530 RepID=A0A2N3IIE3_9BACT|nr:recombination mediator RecR [Raineya orbicola]PKQ70077.1 recR: recombination protein RecR [Raineya orbicola]